MISTCSFNNHNHQLELVISHFRPEWNEHFIAQHPAMSNLSICIFCDLGDKVPERSVASTILSLGEVRRLGRDGEVIKVSSVSEKF